MQHTPNFKLTYRLKDKQLHRSMSYLNHDFEGALGRGFLEAVENMDPYTTVTCYASSKLVLDSPKDGDEAMRKSIRHRSTKYTYFFRTAEIEAVREVMPNVNIPTTEAGDMAFNLNRK